MLLTRACAKGDRRILPNNMFGRLISNEYLARPDTLSGPSMREILLPISVRLSASGHLYSAIAAPSFLSGLRYGPANSHIGSAPAKVAAQPFLNLLGSRIGVLVQECLAGHDKSGSAETALLGVIVDKSLLHRVQSLPGQQAFDRRYLLSLSFDCQHRARINGFAIDDHRTGTARSAVAHAFSAGKVQIVAQRIQQRDAWFHLNRLGLSVYRQLNGHFAGPVDFDVSSCGSHHSMSYNERQGEPDARRLQEVAS